jgi:hypothetical protein
LKEGWRERKRADEGQIKLIYSTSKDALTRACGLHYIIEAHDEDDLEYDNVLSRAKLN